MDHIVIRYSHNALLQIDILWIHFEGEKGPKIACLLVFLTPCHVRKGIFDSTLLEKRIPKFNYLYVRFSDWRRLLAEVMPPEKKRNRKEDHERWIHSLGKFPLWNCDEKSKWVGSEKREIIFLWVTMCVVLSFSGINKTHPDTFCGHSATTPHWRENHFSLIHIHTQGHYAGKLLRVAYSTMWKCHFFLLQFTAVSGLIGWLSFPSWILEVEWEFLKICHILQIYREPEATQKLTHLYWETKIIAKKKFLAWGESLMRWSNIWNSISLLTFKPHRVNIFLITCVVHFRGIGVVKKKYIKET